MMTTRDDSGYDGLRAGYHTSKPVRRWHRTYSQELSFNVSVSILDTMHVMKNYLCMLYDGNNSLIFMVCTSGHYLQGQIIFNYYC
jgi:hypothetical protein